VIKTKAEAAPDADMLSSFVKALHGAIAKNDRLVKLLERMLVQEVDDDQVPTLLKLIEQVDERFESMTSWATKFDCGTTKAKKPRRHSA
jgi:hypothetical protein